jgi:ADP-ribose pyrophosphatase
MTNQPEKVRSSKLIYQGRTILVRQDEIELAPTQLIRRDVISHPGATAIVPITSASVSDAETKLILVRQYRHATREFLWEIPAGTLEPGEDILACAQRELLEETGLRSSVWQKLHVFYPAPGFCDEKMHLYAAFSVNSADTSLVKPPDDEAIESRSFTLLEIESMIKEGQIRDAKSLVGLLLLRSLS